MIRVRLHREGAGDVGPTLIGAMELEHVPLRGDFIFLEGHGGSHAVVGRQWTFGIDDALEADVVLRRLSASVWWGADAA